MDGDIGSLLQSVLSDPTQMEKIAQAAKGLMGSLGGDSAPVDTGTVEAQTDSEEAFVSSQPVTPLSTGETKLLASLGKVFSGSQSPSRSTALLVAMRPYMRPEKQEKLDRAMKIAQMVHIAEVVMRSYGGESHGL
jgi:hypothetical protein